MSKKLLKILAVCIFVTLVPVAVIAIALAATLSAPYTVAVEFKGTMADYQAAANISVNDQLRSGNTVKVKMDDKITITLADGAYDIVGFYEGNAESVIDKSEIIPESSKISYSFNVTSSRTITIWVEAKTYNITYTEEGLTGGEMIYGTDLATIDRADFKGWQVTSAPDGVTTDGTIYTQATFPVKGDYTLAPYYADIDYTVAVEFKGTMADYQAAANISVNDQLRGGNTVNVKMGDKITITLADGAYDTVGFYEGNAESVTTESEKLTDSLISYSFSVEANVSSLRTITIWVEAKTFNITYTEEGLTGGEMIYGTDLATIERAGFKGWQVTSAPEGVTTDGTIYTQATFPVSGDYTLAPYYADIDYTLNVKKHAHSDETSQITFNSINGFDSYDEIRDNYTFVGFNYQGTEYLINEDQTDYLNGEKKLSEVIASSYNEGDTVELTAVWESDYKDTQFSVSISASCGVDYDPVYDSDGNAFEDIECIMSFEDKTDDNLNDKYVYCDLNEKVYDYFFKGETNLYDQDNKLLTGGQLIVSDTNSGTGYTTIINIKDATFADLLKFTNGAKTLYVKFILV